MTTPPIPEGSDLTTAIGDRIPFMMNSRDMAGYIATMSAEQQEAILVRTARNQARLHLQDASSRLQSSGTMVLGSVRFSHTSNPTNPLLLSPTTPETKLTKLSSQRWTGSVPSSGIGDSKTHRRKLILPKPTYHPLDPVIPKDSPPDQVDKEGDSLPWRLSMSHKIGEPSQHQSNPQGVPWFQNTKGIFHNASDFVIKEGEFITPKGDLNVYNNSTDALSWLREYIMRGAQWDSSERDPPPRCHPDTRTNIIERANQWIEDAQRTKRGLWLKGPAGVGKSAIVQTLTEYLAKDGSQRLGASLFFSRPSGRSNPQQVFPTIAYQLAVEHPGYREYIENLMQWNPRSLEKSMSQQFWLLVVVPFVDRQLRLSQHDLLIAIDGLDECDPTEDNTDPTQDQQRTLENVHQEIVQLIGRFVLRYPSIPLIWIIASRPEAHLKAVFLLNEVKESFFEEDVPVDSKEACLDVEKFLAASFKMIQKRYPEYFDDTPWPTHQEFLLIAKAASGLFVFAEVVVRFIQEPRAGNPVIQLKFVLSAISNLNIAQLKTNPLAVLDAIYTAVLARIPPETLENTKNLLQMMMFLHREFLGVDEFNFRNMYEWFEIDKEDAIMAFHHLHSVISFPKVKDIDETHPRFYHSSFREYLVNPSRSNQYSISVGAPLSQKILDKKLLDMFGSEPKALLPRFPKRGGWSQQDSYDLLRRILKTEISISGTWVEFLGDRCTISDVQLQQIFEGLNFKQMLENDIRNIMHLSLHWIVTDSSLRELKRRGILSTSTLGSFYPNVATSALNILYIGLRWDPQLLRNEWTNVAEDCSEEYRQKLYASFCSLVRDEPGTEVRVWGFKDGERWAIIRTWGSDSFWHQENVDAIYITGVGDSQYRSTMVTT